MPIDLLITNCSLLPEPGREQLIAPGFIAVSGSRILASGPMEECPSSTGGTVIDGQGDLAMPGLINGHCHAPMTLFRGMADDLALSSWLNEHIFPAEARHVSAEMAYWCSKLAAAEMLLSGTTTVADGYFFEEEVARAFAEAGLRAIPSQAIIDFPAPGVPDPGERLTRAASFLDAWQDQDPLISPALFAHAPYTCSAETLIRAKELARGRRVPLFLHLAETSQEHSLISSPQGATPTRHLDALGILDRDTICVHCVWVDDQDLDILADRECGVILCPQSNLKLASGIAPLPRMLERGIRVGLGTDGAASNNSLDLFKEMGLAAKIHKIPSLDPVAVPAEQILHAAARGGAAALGLADDLGALHPGKLADILLIDLHQPRMQPFYSPNTLVYSGSGHAVRSVIVHGRLVVEERQILSIDLEETKAHVLRLSGQVAQPELRSPP
ncbi:amidohydrolase [Desulfogranum mediterraneum]|uniref:amidohydrolase n=1 Tax=Desulfogranum mediterraneum TaxID=160661 RepID=UPI00048C99B2|nr:amidohydrolase [Desulfogranum mediterraneum]